MHLRLKISANVRWLFGEYSAISRWSSPNFRRALLPTKHRQWFAKNVNASIENFEHREMLPHEYHEFWLFAEGSVIPPEHRLMLVSFHWECISDTKKAQWDRAITSKQDTETDSLISEDFTLEIVFQRFDVMRTLWYNIIMINAHTCMLLAQDFFLSQSSLTLTGRFQTCSLT